MTDTPLVSVVIPNYNYGQFISEALDSVFNQSYKNIEVIVADDGSTDDSLDIISENHPQVIIIKNSHYGVSRNRNSGISIAKGDYIAFLDSDDTWHPKKIELQLNALKQNPDWLFIGTDKEVRDSFSKINDGNLSHTAITTKDFLTVIPVSCSDIMIHQSCFKKVGLFDESLHGSEDKDLWIRLSIEFEGGKVDAPLWKYRDHPEQCNKNPDLINSTRSSVLKKYFRDFPFSFIKYSPMILGHHFYESAVTHRDDGKNQLKAILYILMSILCAPYTYHKNDKIFDRLKFLIKTTTTPPK